MTLKNQYQIIVVGGGTGGAATAKFLAQRGLEVALFEKKKFSQLHKICGDMTAKHHFEEISRIDPQNVIAPPHGEEVYNSIAGLQFFSPAMQKFPISSNQESWIINREKFGQRLLKEANAAGARLWDEINVLEPLLNASGDQVTGLRIKTKDRKIQEIGANIVVDASGMASVIRKHIPDQKAQWESIIPHYDLVAGYREIVQFEKAIPEYKKVRFYLDSKIAPGGYFWLFPRDAYTANVGLGIEPRRIKSGPKAAYQEWKKREPTLFNGKEKILHRGGATVSLRRPMDTLVYNGLVLIGDAGACVRATDGGGIGFSLLSASYAADPIEKAIIKADFNREGPLWEYNINFMRNLGAQEGPLAMLKVLVANASDKELITILDKGVITPMDINKLNNGIPMNIGLSGLMKRIWGARTIFPFLLRLSRTVRSMQKAKRLYRNYPENWQDFLLWKKQIARLFQDEKRAIDYYRKTQQDKKLREVLQKRIA